MSEKKAEEGLDFYYEGGLLVFTEHYLRARGYCCESGCRHCPWDFANKQRRDVPMDPPAGEQD